MSEIVFRQLNIHNRYVMSLYSEFCVHMKNVKIYRVGILLKKIDLVATFLDHSV